jgi:general secretion pathway protein D
LPKVIDSGATSTLGNFKNPEERSINALIKVKDGQTVVIGGLLREKTDATVTKLPLLGDIPFLGSLFRHKSNEVTTRELLIVLTPHILGMGDIPNGKFTNMNGNTGFHREQDAIDPRDAAITDELNRASSGK